MIRRAVAARPDCDVLVITMFSDASHVTESIIAGASGYLVKNALPQRIASLILEVHAGGSPISPNIARHVLDRFRRSAAPALARGPCAATLTERETHILQLIAKGLAFVEIGRVLGISPHTVVTHVKRIYRKLAVHSRGEAVYEARMLGLV